MTSDEMKKLANNLYNIANEIVGNVGESTTTALSVTGEHYITFGMRFKDESELSSCWKNWVMAYKEFAKYKKDQGRLVYNGEALTIYWRMPPEIQEDPDGQCFLYAILLISARSQDLHLSR